MSDFSLQNICESYTDSMRNYIVDIATHFFEDTLNKISDDQINDGFSRNSISLLAHYLYDSVIDYIQISEGIINFSATPDSLSQDVYNNTLFLVETVNKNKLEDMLTQTISFNQDYDVSMFIRDTLFPKIFNATLLDTFVDIGHSVTDFISNTNLTQSDESRALLELKEEIELKTRELMYGAKYLPLSI